MITKASALNSAEWSEIAAVGASHAFTELRSEFNRKLGEISGGREGRR